jgi:hypothetical protein
MCWKRTEDFYLPKLIEVLLKQSDGPAISIHVIDRSSAIFAEGYPLRCDCSDMLIIPNEVGSRF